MSKNKRVLVVEPSAVARLITLHVLHKLPINCYSVASGEEAIELAEYFDLVLMEVDLPGIDGRETCRRVRRREKLRQLEPVPIVALTHDEDREASLEAGMTDHFLKPMAPGDLKSLVERCLFESRATDEVYG